MKRARGSIGVKVEIQNFQSVEQAELEIRGLTVLVGKSNIGKSAVLRAIGGALSNREGDDFVTDGATHTEVRLVVPPTETAEESASGVAQGGLDLTWRKGGGYNDYVINGEELGSVGRGAPDHIAKAGFAELEVGRESVSVQVADQFAPLFLLDASGAVAAEAISDVGRITEVQTALRACEGDRREHKATRKVRKRDLEDVRAEKAGYETYGDDMRQFTEIRSRWEEALGLEREIAQIKRLVVGASRHERIVKVLDGVDGVEIPDDAPLSKIDELASQMDHIRRLRDSSRRAFSVCEKLDGVDAVILPEFESDLSERLSEIRVAQSLLDRARHSVRMVKALGGVEEVELPEVDFTERFAEVDQIADLIDRVRLAATRGKEAKEALPTLDEHMEALDAQIHELLHEAGVCPTCEREMR